MSVIVEVELPVEVEPQVLPNGFGGKDRSSN